MPSSKPYMTGMFATMLLYFFTLPLVFLAQAGPTAHYVPAKAAKGDAIVDMTARPGLFDAPYLSKVNTTVFEWWWFEAVANDLQSTLTVIFFTTSGNGFPLSGNTAKDVTSVYVTGLLPNGTIFAESLPASGATLSSAGPGNSIAGDFHGAGATFKGNPDLSEFVVSLNSAEIKGELRLKSTAPPHYTCSENLASGQDLQVFPHVGWSNAQPSADACGKVKVGDQLLEFNHDLGYHDHNWGDRPFTSVIQSWYWGHAKLGPYTFVWFDGIDSTGEEHVSGYLSKGDRILLSSCKPGSIKARPVGGPATYPPHPGRQSFFRYLDVTMELDSGKQFYARVKPQSINLQGKPLYTRWIGPVSGGIVGETQYESIAAMEEFTVF